jgi:hypothetical protein
VLLSGVAVGEKVIVNPLERIRDRARVTTATK